jgi:hypothetical protein
MGKAVHPRMHLSGKAKRSINLIWPTFFFFQLTLTGLHITFILQYIDLVFQLEHQRLSSG